MGHALELIGRTLGFGAVACAFALSLPGVQAVRADDPAPAVSAAQTPDASFEGFATYMNGEGRSVAVETVGPACNAAPQDPIAVEMAHRQAMVALKARMMAQARAAAAAGTGPEIVMLNGSGYNYRPDEPGVPSPAVPRPARP